MKKQELVELVQKHGGFETKKLAEAAVDGFVSAISEALSKKESVDIIGFGKFEAVMQKGKEGKVPGTDKTYKTEDKYVPKFKPGKKLKDTVAK